MRHNPKPTSQPPVTETWRCIAGEFRLMRTYAGSGRFTFEIVPQYPETMQHLKDLTAIVSHLRAMGVSEKELFRSVSKVLSASPQYRLVDY